MKKSTILIIAIIMGVSFVALLVMQLYYISSMARMKREQFDESVNRALYQAARNLELNQTLSYLEKDINDSTQHANEPPVVRDSTRRPPLELRAHTAKPATMPKGIILNTDKDANAEATRAMREALRDRYVYQKGLLDEVIYRMLNTSQDIPLRDRINFKLLDQDIKAELLNNGLDIPYHFAVLTRDGRAIYHCPDYASTKKTVYYTQTLFRNDSPRNIAVVRVHFPNMGNYIYDSVKFVIPSLIFTLILLFTFIFTLVVVFRQKKLSELKNDFINNMTHELKTPISSISLASQMLGDKNMVKTDEMLARLSEVFSKESQRLRFLVDRVLQTSMFDQQAVIYNTKELDINELVETTVSTFRLRVEHTNGHIHTNIEALDSTVKGDEMHLQNVMFNLLDNAVKYQREDTPVELTISTWNPDKAHVSIEVKDNGIGIKKENLKKIYDKFYRVHTGNRHDVKGFGLGLAYVRQIVGAHGGDIRVESEPMKGTTFIITLHTI